MPDKKLGKKLYEFGHMFKPDAYKDQTLAEGLMQNLDNLLTFYDRSMARITQINRSVELTVRGKQEPFSKLKSELAKELTDLGKPIAGYADQIAALERDANPTRHPKDDAAYEIRQREIRDVLRQMDPSAAEAEFMSAAEAGNSEVLAAVLHSPVGFRFATADLVAKISRQQWAREFPDDANKLRDLQTAHSEAISALGSVKADLARQGLERIGEDATQADAA